MPDETPPKITYTADDLKTKQAISELQSKCIAIDPTWTYNSNDSEGYTPLCFAAMNGIKPDKIVCLIKDYHCTSTKKCGKGKTPLQCAIMSGCKESVDALIGNDVYVYDDVTEDIVDSTTEAPESEQPKKDAVDNPVPARDDEDNVIYIKDTNGVVYPLDPNNLKDPSSVTAEPVTQQLGRLVKDGEVFPIPPDLVSYSIVYKYEDDGTHSPMRDDEGNPIKQCNADGSEIHKKDEEGKDIRNKFEYVWDYEYQPEYAVAYLKATTKINTPATVTKADLSEAAKLPKSDILEALGSRTSFSDYAEITDSYDITLLYSACMMSCYASVDYILGTLVKTNRASYILRECGTDDDSKKSALAVAVDNEDEMLVEKLCHYLVGSSSLGDVFEIAFAHEWHSVVNALLRYSVTDDNIYSWLSESYTWGSGPGSRSIVKYIEYEHNDKIYDLLLKNYDISKLATFTSNQCYNIIAHLYKKNKEPFNNGSKFNILITDLRLTSVYDGVVAALFSDGEVDLKDVCDIADETKRNACIDKIFTTPYNKQLFSSLVNTESDNRNSIISHLYSNNYFTLQKLVDLCTDPSDYNKFNGIIDTLNVDLSTVNSEITDNGEFKQQYIAHMLVGNKTTISDIEGIVTDESLKSSAIVKAFRADRSKAPVSSIISTFSSATACSILNSLYDSGGYNNALELEDIFTIYNNYSDGLSSLHDDLKPFIGSMKYSDKAIATEFYWLYQFSSHSGMHWSNPQSYSRGLTSNMKSSSLLTVQSSGKYTSVRILDESGAGYSPNKFRLYTDLNSIPEIYTDESHDASSDINGVIVSFNSSVTTDKFTVPKGVVYTISEDTHEIKWNTDHLLYKLLRGVSARCYTTTEDINRAPIAQPSASPTSCHQGATITLQAHASDQDGDTITYEWSCDHDGEFSSTSSADTTFTIPANLTGNVIYTFTIKVTDNFGASNTATTSVNASYYANTAPQITVPTPLVEGNPGDTVTLSIDVVDVDDDEYNVVWSGPEASHLISVNEENKRFKIPENAVPNTTYAFTITVTDTHGNSSTASITVKVAIPATIGTLAFTSGTFAVDLDPGTLVYTTKSAGEVTQHSEVTKDKWSSVYNNGFKIQQVPKSPYWTSSNKVFYYDLLYSEDSDT